MSDLSFLRSAWATARSQGSATDARTLAAHLATLAAAAAPDQAPALQRFRARGGGHSHRWLVAAAEEAGHRRIALPVDQGTALQEEVVARDLAPCPRVADAAADAALVHRPVIDAVGEAAACLAALRPGGRVAAVFDGAPVAGSLHAKAAGRVAAMLHRDLAGWDIGGLAAPSAEAFVAAIATRQPGLRASLQAQSFRLRATPIVLAEDLLATFPTALLLSPVRRIELLSKLTTALAREAGAAREVEVALPMVRVVIDLP